LVVLVWFAFCHTPPELFTRTFAVGLYCDAFVTPFRRRSCGWTFVAVYFIAVPLVTFVPFTRGLVLAFTVRWVYRTRCVSHYRIGWVTTRTVATDFTHVTVYLPHCTPHGLRYARLRTRTRLCVPFGLVTLRTRSPFTHAFCYLPVAFATHPVITLPAVCLGYLCPLTHCGLPCCHYV